MKKALFACVFFTHAFFLWCSDKNDGKTPEEQKKNSEDRRFTFVRTVPPTTTKLNLAQTAVAQLSPGSSVIIMGQVTQKLQASSHSTVFSPTTTTVLAKVSSALSIVTAEQIEKNLNKSTPEKKEQSGQAAQHKKEERRLGLLGVPHLTHPSTPTPRSAHQRPSPRPTIRHARNQSWGPQENNLWEVLGNAHGLAEIKAEIKADKKKQRPRVSSNTFPTSEPATPITDQQSTNKRSSISQYDSYSECIDLSLFPPLRPSHASATPLSNHTSSSAASVNSMHMSTSPAIPDGLGSEASRGSETSEGSSEE